MRYSSASHLLLSESCEKCQCTVPLFRSVLFCKRLCKPVCTQFSDTAVYQAQFHEKLTLNMQLEWRHSDATACTIRHSLKTVVHSVHHRVYFRVLFLKRTNHRIITDPSPYHWITNCFFTADLTVNFSRLLPLAFIQERITDLISHRMDLWNSTVRFCQWLLSWNPPKIPIHLTCYPSTWWLLLDFLRHYRHTQRTLRSVQMFANGVVVLLTNRQTGHACGTVRPQLYRDNIWLRIYLVFDSFF